MPSRKSSGRVARTEQERVSTVGVVAYSRPYRGALVALLQGVPTLIVTDLGEGGEETHRQLEHLRPDALLVDIPRNRMAPLIRSARRLQPGLVILAVNCDETEEDLLPLFVAGLTGFVPHDAGGDELLLTVRAALDGEIHCPPKIVAALVRRLHGVDQGTTGIEHSIRLTPRENQIARYLEQGLSNKQIAVRLGIGLSTAKNHVHNILGKLDSHRREEAVQRLGSREEPPLRLLGGRKHARRLPGDR